MIAGMPSVTVISRSKGFPCCKSSRIAEPPIPLGSWNSPAWIGSFEPNSLAIK
jgi:hypothetical protein